MATGPVLKADQLEALAEISEGLKDFTGLEAFSQKLLSTLTQVLRASASTLVVQGGNEHFERIAALGRSVNQTHFRRIENELAHRVQGGRKPIFKRITPEEAQSLEQEGYFWAYPLSYKDQIGGVLLICSNRPPLPDDKRFLSLLAPQLGATIENIKLEGKMRWEAKEFLTLIEVGTALCSELDFKAILDLVAFTAVKLVKGETASLMLLDDKARLNVEATYGLDKEALRRAGKKGHPVAQWVAQKEEPLLLTDLSEDPRFKNLTRKRRRIKSALSVPLKANGRVIGVLNVDNVQAGRCFDQGDLNILTILASQAGIAIENARLYTELREVYLSMLQALVFTTEDKNMFRGHAERVAEYALAIAKKLDLPAQFRENLRYAGLLHDIGKVGVPREFLADSSSLASEDEEVLPMHPQLSAKILRPIKFLKEIIPLVWHHHERYDGQDHTGELAGEEIPLGARILAVSDAYVSMVSPRPYGSALTDAEAVAELRRSSGNQFDPKIVDTFLSIIVKEEKSPTKKP